MPTDKSDAATRVDVPNVMKRISQYLSNGGLFNPESMEHDKVRELLMDCRVALQQERLAGQEEMRLYEELAAIIRVSHDFDIYHTKDVKCRVCEILAAIRSITIPAALQPLCADCGRPENDAGMHVDGPGSNWGAALHHFRAAPKEDEGE